MDAVRIFKTAAAFLLVTIFLILLASAYSRHRETIRACGLVEASSSITNRLVLQELSAGRSYTVDPGRIGTLPCRISIGGDNFLYSVRLTFRRGGERVTVSHGPETPEFRPVSSLSVPVSVLDGFRLEAGLLEVIVWRE